MPREQRAVRRCLESQTLLPHHCRCRRLHLHHLHRHCHRCRCAIAIAAIPAARSPRRRDTRLPSAAAGDCCRATAPTLGRPPGAPTGRAGESSSNSCCRRSPLHTLELLEAALDASAASPLWTPSLEDFRLRLRRRLDPQSAGSELRLQRVYTSLLLPPPPPGGLPLPPAPRRVSSRARRARSLRCARAARPFSWPSTSMRACVLAASRRCSGHSASVLLGNKGVVLDPHARSRAARARHRQTDLLTTTAVAAAAEAARSIRHTPDKAAGLLPQRRRRRRQTARVAHRRAAACARARRCRRRRGAAARQSARHAATRLAAPLL